MSFLKEEGNEIKIGLEIHFQVKGRKLFCSCPGEEDRTNLGSFVRKLTVVSGEKTDKDVAAVEEAMKGRIFEYIISENSCLVEMDEEPPHPPGEETISAAILVSLMLGCRIVDNIHFMRKIVIDGSNTSGFQRTGIVGISGLFNQGRKDIGIATVTLEEEACRKIKEEAGKVTYSLDRLGIPLIEISTEPDIKTPREAREVAESIGFTVRRSGMIRREVSSIRQDLNISIDRGNRVEIKGVQSLSQIEKVLEKEVERQKSLIKISRILSGRKMDVHLYSMDLTETDFFKGSSLISKARREGKRIIAVKLPGLRGLLNNGEFRLGSEIADRLRAQGIGGIIHSDELPAYGISEEDKSKLFSELKCGDEDAFGILAINGNEIEKALRIVQARISEAFRGVPAETRAAVDDRTRFLRPLPSSSRMYPETDVPIIKIQEDFLKRIKDAIPPGPEERAKYLESLGVPAQEANVSVKKGYDDALEDFIKEFGNPKLCAKFLSLIFSSEKKDVEMGKFLMERQKLGNIPFDALEPLYLKGEFSLPDGRTLRISNEGGLKLYVVENGKTAEIGREYRYGTLSTEDLEKMIDDILEKNKNVILERGEGAFKLLMGKIMNDVRGQFSGSEISRHLQLKLSKFINEAERNKMV
ncbi:MAG: Glu-tRNA(Gln) amidotransferase subunit GatE [Thermoplasmatales archaeon]